MFKLQTLKKLLLPTILAAVISFFILDNLYMTLFLVLFGYPSCYKEIVSKGKRSYEIYITYAALIGGWLICNYFINRFL